MDRLEFYQIEKEYLNYLRRFESKVPEHVTDGHTKPFCGVLLTINGLNYFAPISSYAKKEYTNIAIKEINRDTNELKTISTIRFCFMVPVPKSVLKIMEFKKYDYYYKNLVTKEYLFCQENKENIRQRANKIYSLKPNHQWYNQCCNFRLLEQKCLEYVQADDKIKEINEQDVAITE